VLLALAAATAATAVTAGAQPIAKDGPAAATRAVATTALTPAVRDSLRTAIRRLVDSAGLPSLTVGISVGGRTVWAEGFGYADLARRVPVTPDTRYSLASISKPITATAVMRLVEQGRVALDAPANRYLRAGRITSVAGSADSATVGRLLSHTAGIPLHYRFYYAGPTGRIATPDVAGTIDRYGRVMFPPGTVYTYSNLGYGILGEIVASASGTTYEAYLRDHVFAPLGMTRTTVSTGAGLANSAVRYDAARRPVPNYDFDHRAASAVYSTANDLLRFAEFHMGTHRAVAPGFLSTAGVRRMQEVATPPAATPGGYGLGWFVDDDNGVRRVRHTGGMPGVNTVLALYPDAGVAVVALANQASPLPGRLAADLAAAVMPSYARTRTARLAAADTMSRAQGLGARPPAAPAAFAAPAAARGTWRGTVRLHDRTVPLVLWVGESDVRARFGDAPALWTLVNDATFANGLLGGRFVGTVPTDDARRAPHVIAMLLRLHEGTLRGWLAAQVTAPTNDFSLSSYADLVKDSTGGAP
jgi:CubicO group peptidase (beta-lactamase class C family)